ncbi:MAG: ROK family protein [Candidatus Omnitrophica bacterium]|nr:ROK family protein [Candidatus Omnitrophota bacterium]MBU4488427.1 ROK family protein [Candidatus Omnitrophota bacterium]MCG2704943.1 ROK family protein [Candidatus Omnitrophota bacterium]
MAGIKGLFTGIELGDKEKKNLLILDAIRKKGPIGRTEISKLTGFNIVTVSNYIDHYIKEGLVSEGGYDTSSGGRKPMLVDLNYKSAHVIGVGFDMLDMVGVVTDLRSNILYQLRKKRPAETGKALLSNLIEMVEEILNKSALDRKSIKGIGLAVAGIIDKDNMSIRWPGVLGTPDVIVSASLLDALERRFGIPVVVENDADCAAFGEQWLALDPELKNVIYMYSGVSCGIMINGQIYRGASGCAGELGILSPRNLDKYDWRRESRGLGRWNMELSTLDNIKEIYEKHGDSKIFKLAGGAPDKVTFSSIVEAAHSKDETAIQLLNKAGKDLGRKVAFLVNLLNPQVVVIGGGVERAGSFLFDPLKDAVKEWAFEEAARALKIVPAQLAENAVSLGAASVVVQKYFENM